MDIGFSGPNLAIESLRRLMNIPILGPLIPDPSVPEWLVAQPREIPLLGGRKLPIILNSLEEADEQEAESAITSFLKLGPADRLGISLYVFAHYKKISELVSNEDLGCQIESPEEVWQHVHPSEVFVKRRARRDCAIYISVAAECDWEREHGLQIVFKGGNQLVRVSDQDGHLTHADAYDVPEEQNRIVS
jgi:hypothetical protein